MFEASLGQPKSLYLNDNWYIYFSGSTSAVARHL